MWNLTKSASLSWSHFYYFSFYFWTGSMEVLFHPAPMEILVGWEKQQQWTKLKLPKPGVKASPKAPISLWWVGPGLQPGHLHSCLLPKPQALTWKKTPCSWLTFLKQEKDSKCSAPAYKEALTSVFTLITPSSVRVLVSITGNPSACKSVNIFWEYKEKMRDMLFPSPHEQILLSLNWVL